MRPDDIVLVTMAVAAAVVLACIWLYVTGRVPGRERDRGVRPVPCAYRPRGEQPWRRGTLQYHDNRLDHYGLGLSRPLLHRWSRGTLDLGRARSVPVSDVPLPQRSAGAVVVDCVDGGHRFELALGGDHYTALRAWLEALPPGWHTGRA